MNRRRLFSLMSLGVMFAATIMFHSCTKVTKNLLFNLSMQTGSVSLTIPATPLTFGTTTFGPATNTYNVDSFIKAQTGTLLGVGNISSVKLTSCVLVVNNPNKDNNLQNFKSAGASFSSNTNSTPYQVNIPNIPDSYSALMNLSVDTTAELKSYLGNQFNYSISGEMRKATSIPLNCTLQFTFKVVVQG